MGLKVQPDASSYKQRGMRRQRVENRIKEGNRIVVRAVVLCDITMETLEGY